MKRALGFTLTLLMAAAGCAGDLSNEGTSRERATGKGELALDDVGVPVTGVSLLALDPGADRAHLVRVVEEQLHGSVFLALGPRLLTARLPAGTDAVLQQLGVASKYDRALDPAELAGASTEEARFVRIFDNTYFPAGTKATLRTAPAKIVLPAGEPFERAPVVPPAGPRGPLFAPGEPDPNAPLDRVPVPFASGTVVVSIVLPESNGVIDPSSEDWSEQAIVETYQKVQTALEAVARTEPNSGLRFVVHYESRPGAGGLAGTVDCDYEFGQRSAFGGADEPEAQANVLTRILGRPITPETYWDAELEYVGKLKTQYHADAGFIVFVGADGNGTAGLRAHATLGGPWTTLSSDYGYETFMHEFGHIFGALDEYCPDACNLPTALGGYLGIINANATYRLGGPGINDGQGEDQNSLMIGNSTNAVNGYTRGQWGWIDTDGDGIVEVRDTFPRSNVQASVSGTRVHVVGTLQDTPVASAASFEGSRSVNRIDALQYRLAGVTGAPWLEVPVADTGASKADVDLDLGDFPGGNYTVEVRARNSVGNVEPAATSLAVAVARRPSGASLPPRVQVEAAPRAGSTRSPFALTATTFDFDPADVVQVRFDANGDGTWDTPFGAARSVTARFARPGVYHPRVEARDREGLRAQASVELYVLDGNAGPSVTIAGGRSPLVGGALQAATLRVATAEDPEGDPVQFNWIAESALLGDDPFRVESGFACDNDTFSLSLRTPIGLRYHTVDLSAGDPSLANTWGVMRIVQLRPNLLAVAAGKMGLIVSDITDRQKPRLVAHLGLETSADRLLLVGNRLYVLGALLTVVDVTNPQAPVELPQARAASLTRVFETADEGPIDPGSEKGAGEYFDLSFAEKITDIRIEVVVDHPAPGELRFFLHGGGDGTSTEILLRDPQPGPAGLQTYSFDPTSAPGLSQLLGKPPSGLWDVRVADVVAGGSSGTLKSARLTLTTSARAAKVLPDANALLGGLSDRYVVVAGRGLQVLDVQTVDRIREASRFDAGPTNDGALIGSTAYVLAYDAPIKTAALAAEGASPARSSPAIVGFYAVDLSNPRRPLLRRADPTKTAQILEPIGSRLYLTTYPAKGDAGQVAVDIVDPRAFLGYGNYVIGSFAAGMGSGFGDDRAIWITDGGKLEHWSVVNPRAARLLASYSRPNAGSILPLEPAQAIAYDGALSVKIVNLGEEVSTESRTFRVTLEARDSQGVVASASRTIHMVPYDHAPTIDGITFSQKAAGEVASFVVAASDVDSSGPWDPTWLLRADLDGDGVYESPWSYFSSATGPLTLSNAYAAIGRHHARFQVRDGFFASGVKELDFEVK